MNRIIRLAAAVAVLATAVACDEVDRDLTIEEAEIVMSEGKGLSSYCDAEIVAEYCFGAPRTDILWGAGQCLGQNEYVPGACILVDPAFGPCQYQGEFCNIIGAH